MPTDGKFGKKRCSERGSNDERANTFGGKDEEEKEKKNQQSKHLLSQ